MLHSKSSDMAWRYLQGWLIPDILSCVSVVEYFLVLSANDDDVVASSGSTMGIGGEDAANLSNMRAAKLVRLLKLAKLMKLARMKRSLERLGDNAYERFGGDLLLGLGAFGSVLQLIVGFALSMHLVACTWYFIGGMEANGWVNELYPEDDEKGSGGTNQTTVPVFTRYMTSMFSIMLAQFAGDPMEASGGEQIFAIISVLINGFIFGSVAATFSSIVTQLAEPYAEYNTKMDALKTWMRTKHFDYETQHEIEAFYSAKLSGIRGKVIDEEAILAAFQPAPIAHEIVNILYTQTVKHVPVFSQLEEELITKLCLCLTQQPALKGTPVVVQGRVADCMYIVNKGRLQNWEETAGAPLYARCVIKGQEFWTSVYDVRAAPLILSHAAAWSQNRV